MDLLNLLWQNFDVIIVSLFWWSLWWWFFSKFLLDYFAKKSLEYYKNEYKKEFEKYNIYLNKKHLIYSELYSMLDDVLNNINSLYANGAVRWFMVMDLDQVEMNFTNLNLCKNYKNRFDTIIENKIAENEQKRLFRALYYDITIKEEINKFKDYYRKNCIYFSPKIDKLLDNIILKINRIDTLLLLHYVNDKNHYEEIHKFFLELSVISNSLKDNIKQELRK